MIRFCDLEICCGKYNELDRSAMLNYFMQNHMDELICVLDEEEKFKGTITYHSLLNNFNVSDAIRTDCVVLDQNIWKNARYYFASYKKSLNENVLLPIIDKQRQLISFAYEDLDANREMRILRELSESTDALQFPDVYPDYNCVRIYEFNELAFFFTKYLERCNVRVCVYGELWKTFFSNTTNKKKSKKYMDIYAEGVDSKKSNWVDNLLVSVSAEFECIDNIYETNIKKGYITDAMGNMNELLSCLKDKKEIVILGSGREAQDVYDFLKANNIDIACFVNENSGERLHEMFGKEILTNLDARKKYTNCVFLECLNAHSAWGMGETDYYDYIGYKRNERFYLIRDYMDIPQNNLINVLKDRKLILMGNIELCNFLYDFFAQKKLLSVNYLNVSKQKDISAKMPEIDIEDIEEGSTCLLVLPELLETKCEQKIEEQKKHVTALLKECRFTDYTNYFSYPDPFIIIEKYNKNKYTEEFLAPKKVILGSIETNAGSVFFRGLLDNHPQIMMLFRSHLNGHLFWICIRLATYKSQYILSAFWEMCNNDIEYTKFCDVGLFNEKMKQLLSMRERFTSQELFVMIHISFSYMCGKNLLDNDIRNMIIYWEPHEIARKDTEEFVNWLGTEKVKCEIVNVVRNVVMMNGAVRLRLQEPGDKRRAFETILNYPMIEKKSYWGRGSRLVIKFEDLKCNPKKILLKICERWEIEWSETLLLTTRNGEVSYFNNGKNFVSGFDLKPVYNLNEMYFSEYDRFRMMIICSPWQRKYGYPYVSVKNFTRRELQSMFLKRFRFEDTIHYGSARLEREFRIGLYNFIRNNLQKVRMLACINE